MTTVKLFLRLCLCVLCGAVFSSFASADIFPPQPQAQKKVRRVVRRKPFVGPVAPEPDGSEKMQKALSHRVVSLANQLDSFFGAKRTDDEKNGSTLRVIPSYRVSEYRTPVGELEIRLNLKLLNLEKEGKNLEDRFFARQEEPEDELDFKSSTAAEQAYEKQVEKMKREQEQWGWNYNVENRIIVKNPLAFFSKFRVRKNFQGSFFTHRFYNEFGWASDTYWQELASFSSDYEMNRFLLFRFSNELNWLFSTNAISSSHGPSFIQSLSSRDSISYDLRMIGVIEKFGWTLDSYGPSLTYRRQLENKWIFYELNPALTFARIDDFKRAFSFFIRFEFVFGDI